MLLIKKRVYLWKFKRFSPSVTSGEFRELKNKEKWEWKQTDCTIQELSASKFKSFGRGNPFLQFTSISIGNYFRNSASVTMNSLKYLGAEYKQPKSKTPFQHLNVFYWMRNQYVRNIVETAKRYQRNWGSTGIGAEETLSAKNQVKNVTNTYT